MTASMWGADADELDRLARSLAAVADSLEGTRNRVSAAVGSSPWQGRDAQRFRSEWGSAHARQLAETATALRTVSEQLSKQALEQRTASAATGASSVGAPGVRGGANSGPSGPMDTIANAAALIGGMGKQAFNWATANVTNMSLIPAAASAAAFIASNRAVIGRYTNAWRDVQRLPKRLGMPKLFNFKSSPAIQWMHPKLAPHLKLLNKADSVLGRATPILNFLTFAGHAADIHDAVTTDGVTGFRSVIAASEATASTLKLTKNPVGYLGGVAIQAWSEAAKAAKEADFSEEARSMTLDHMSKASVDDWRKITSNTLRDLVQPMLRIVSW